MPTEIEQLKQRIESLEGIINYLVFTNRYEFKKDIYLGDTVNIVFNKTNGTKIGTSTSQKIGFYNATPIAQRANSSQAVVSTDISTQTTPYGYATQAQADGIVTLVNELRAALVAVGLIKGSS